MEYPDIKIINKLAYLACQLDAITEAADEALRDAVDMGMPSVHWDNIDYIIEDCSTQLQYINDARRALKDFDMVLAQIIHAREELREVLES